MANTIQIKRKTTTGAPTVGSLVDGEMCLVVPDSALYQRVNSSTLILINVGSTAIVVGTTAPSNPSVNDLWIDTN